MGKEITFQPGKFSPVVEVAQRDTGITAPADTSFTGLEEVAKSTLFMSAAASKGSGAVVSDPTPAWKLSLIIGNVLAIRNVVEQLSFISVFVKFGSSFTKPNGSFLEPLVRAYNFYGHFTHEGKTYVTRGLEEILINALFQLRNYATREVVDGDKHTVIDQNCLKEIDTDFYHLSEEGEISFGKLLPFKDYLEKLISYVSENSALGDTSFRIPLMQQILSLSTEDSLRRFLRYAKTIENWRTPGRLSADQPTDRHKAAMKRLFGREYSGDGDTIPGNIFAQTARLAYALLHRVSLERSHGMKTCSIPKYEGGSASQLAAVHDDVLYSSVPLSLVDSTGAIAFSTSHGCVHNFHSAVQHDRDELLRELVSQSLIT